MSDSKLTYTPIEDIPQIYETLQKGFRSGKTKSIAYRKEQLAQLSYLIHDNKARFREAFTADLGRPAEEVDMLELSVVLAEMNDLYDNVAKWSATEKAPFDASWFLMSPAIRKEPKGVVLIIAPFNYPVMLALGPLASAMAAGCAVVVKPSELTPTISGLMGELMPKYLDQDMYQMVNGSIPETTRLLELKWDHIMYTGSGRVAKIISVAAAQHLTPVTLELGGKSPVVIDPKCDVNTAAKRILWGKIANAGQICLAPDYVLVPRDFQDTFVAAVQRAYKEFFATGAKPDVMSHIVTTAHTQRIKRLIDETKGTVVFGGKVDLDGRWVEPTLVKDVKGDDSLMSEEIFGPVLPIIPVKDVDEAIEFINARDDPLGLYIFSNDSAFKAKVIDNTRSGGASVNEVVVHFATHGLPFGGIGPSGYGYGHGKYGFDTFTHLRSTLDNPNWIDTILMSGRYPPYKVRV
ncbi:NAD-dependent aldehyde dehydrogenase [Laetiporus sulphureus 93-53]|uniref:Aldehyde dehydrogenase n=1 Tax=Laetiporus sulphureus 93-53 TaxID=1314785 RepID=A0A165CC04_9APHY|nr:NAD-dependent aldehyde dehydrogenase [Laetiporus sulphureus 93-53]KZT02538.1 NAD-dependent aldehyde dehydrogenase [Laetiporus sulphureus 93-53]